MGAQGTTWVREDHTEAKHNLLRAFFIKWVSIHSGHFVREGRGRVRVYDGFAGPGIYSGGEPGSPLILLRALYDHPHLREKWSGIQYEFQFVEKDAGRAQSLREQLEKFEAELEARDGVLTNVRWDVTHGSYEDHIPEDVPGPSALFLFIDPFGYSTAPMTLTQDLIQQPKSDTLIFLPLSFVHRFKDREGQDAALDRFFGTPTWREVPPGRDRPQKLLALFQDQLRKAGLEWVLPFRLKPADSTNEYWIVGGSGHPAGFASIKEGYWTVDPVDGQGFAAPQPAVSGQGAFAIEEPEPEPNTAPLLALLREEFGSRPFTVEEAEEATRRSRFLDTHLRVRTLRPAEKAEPPLLNVTRPDGAKQFKAGRGITMQFTS